MRKNVSLHECSLFVSPVPGRDIEGGGVRLSCEAENKEQMMP